jgi:hypothetical protein
MIFAPMLLTKIQKYSSRLLLGFLPFFMTSSLIHGPESLKTVQETPSSKQVVIVEQSGSIGNFNSLTSGAKKVSTPIEILTILSLKAEGNLQIIRSVAYRSSFTNGSVVNYRMHSFLSSHFSTST